MNLTRVTLRRMRDAFRRRFRAGISLLGSLTLILALVAPVQATLAPPQTQLYVAYVQKSALALSYTPLGGRPSFQVYGLFRLELDGGASYQFTDEPDWHATWSPDGLQYVAINESRVVRVNRDGGERAVLYECPEGCADPIWSPTGDLIAFTVIRQRGFLESDIFLIQSDGTNLRQLTTEIEQAATPAWSPDGTQLAIGAYDPASDDVVIHVIDLEAEIIHTIAVPGTDLRHPTWSPQGDRVAFTGITIREYLLNSLYAADIDGSNLETLATNTSLGLWWFFNPVWSPDGDYIALDWLIVPPSLNSGVFHIATGEFIPLGGGGNVAWIP